LASTGGARRSARKRKKWKPKRPYTPSASASGGGGRVGERAAAHERADDERDARKEEGWNRG
jgi:hypothetical protein